MQEYLVGEDESEVEVGEGVGVGVDATVVFDVGTLDVGTVSSSGTGLDITTIPKHQVNKTKIKERSKIPAILIY